jgi:Na+-transporting methylmalonyl-CoA/oxaloacetate decarboxylase gamma subunit
MALWIYDPGPTEGMVYLFLFIIALFIVYLIARVMTKSSVTKSQVAAELEKEKLKVIQQDMADKALPFTRLSADQVTSLRTIDQENEVLGTTIYAKRKEVEGRLARLENYITQAKLDSMLVKITHEEKKRR